MGKVFRIRENNTAMARLITRDSVARDSGGHHIELLYNVYTSSASRGHTRAMDFPLCTRAC